MVCLSILLDSIYIIYSEHGTIGFDPSQIIFPGYSNYCWFFPWYSHSCWSHSHYMSKCSRISYTIYCNDIGLLPIMCPKEACYWIFPWYFQLWLIIPIQYIPIVGVIPILRYSNLYIPKSENMDDMINSQFRNFQRLWYSLCIYIYIFI